MQSSSPPTPVGNPSTMTCYLCGYPTSTEWAKNVSLQPTPHGRPFYPFLLQRPPPGASGSAGRGGTACLCPFCHALLTAQWNFYEDQQLVPPENRQYTVNHFICAVCGVATYRKRVQPLPLKEFPFLERKRKRGSITLSKSSYGKPYHAVVCLDCSETLWAQSSEYDRWGLPLQKRQYNWMSQVPPPEESEDAPFARLPSGQKQFPKYLSTEPVSVPLEVLELERSRFDKRLPAPTNSSDRPQAIILPPPPQLCSLPETPTQTRASIPHLSDSPPPLVLQSVPHQSVIAFAPKSTANMLPSYESAFKTVTPPTATAEEDVRTSKTFYPPKIKPETGDPLKPDPPAESHYSGSGSSDELEVVYARITTKEVEKVVQEVVQCNPDNPLRPPTTTPKPPLITPKRRGRPPSKNKPPPNKLVKPFAKKRGRPPGSRSLTKKLIIRKTKTAEKKSLSRNLVRKRLKLSRSVPNTYEKETRTISVATHSRTLVSHQFHQSSILSNVAVPPPGKIFPVKPIPARPTFPPDPGDPSQLPVPWPYYHVPSEPSSSGPTVPRSSYWTHLKDAANALLRRLDNTLIDETAFGVIVGGLCKHFSWELYGVYGVEERLEATRQCIWEELQSLRNEFFSHETN